MASICLLESLKRMRLALAITILFFRMPKTWLAGVATRIGTYLTLTKGPAAVAVAVVADKRMTRGPQTLEMGRRMDMGSMVMVPATATATVMAVQVQVLVQVPLL
jgi:hypothetical protein